MIVAVEVIQNQGSFTVSKSSSRASARRLLTSQKRGREGEQPHSQSLLGFGGGEGKDPGICWSILQPKKALGTRLEGEEWMGEGARHMLFPKHRKCCVHKSIRTPYIPKMYQEKHVVLGNRSKLNCHCFFILALSLC